MALVHNLYDHITPELESFIGGVTTVTGKILSLEANPAVEAIAAIVPNGTAIEAAVNTGINIIQGVGTGVETLATKIGTLINGAATPTALHGAVVKLAQTAVKVGDPTPPAPEKTEVFYDTVVQNAIAIAQANAPKTAAATTPAPTAAS